MKASTLCLLEAVTTGLNMFFAEDEINVSVCNIGCLNSLKLGMCSTLHGSPFLP